VALSRGFPRVNLSTTLPCDVRTFLEALCHRGCLTCTTNLARERAAVKARVRIGAAGAHHESLRCDSAAAQTLLSKPTTRPSTLTSLLRIGSIASFSG